MTTGRDRWRSRVERAAAAARSREEPVISQAPRRSRYLIQRAEQEEDLRRALAFLLRLGTLLMRTGASSRDIEASIVACGMALGQYQVEAAITYTQVQISLANERGDTPVNDMRIVRVRAPDYNRLVALHQLVLALTEEGLDRHEAYERLETIRHQPNRYPRWGITAAGGTLAAAVAVQLGAGWLLALVTFVTAGVVDRVNRFLAGRHIPDFYLNLVGGALVTGVAVALVAVGLPVQPPLVVAGGVILLLPTVALLASVQDALTGFMVTSAGRAMEVVVLVVGITAGVAAALVVARQAGVTMPVQPSLAFTLSDLPAQFASAGVVAAAMAVLMYAPVRLLPPSFVLGGLGYVGLVSLDNVLQSPALSRAVIAVVIGLLAQLYALRRRLPALAVVLPAITPMLPGLIVYAATLRLTYVGIGGLSGLLLAAAEALALAAGVILGELLAQPKPGELGSSAYRYAGPTMIGPLRVLRQRSRTHLR
jgi:uncharacterized membrane protein YjjP (DUF1212 family)